MKNNYIISYAQNREDIILSAFFLNQKKGFYVDVGANEPKHDSVTKYFYDRGWTGINIEPSPTLFAKLSEARPRDINLNIGISDKSGTLLFREYEGHGLSTFSASRKTELNNSDISYIQNFKDYEVKVHALKDVFKKHKVSEIDFMKIDVEGYESEVIKGNDWEKYRPKVLCIEANHINQDWPSFLRQKAYSKIFNDGLNDYYIDSSSSQPIEFNYLDAAVGRRIIPNFAQSHIEDINSLKSDIDSALRQVQKLELENQIIREKIGPLIYENEDLRNKIKEQSRLRNQVKSLLATIDEIFLVHMAKLNNRNLSKPPTELAVTKSTQKNAEEVLIQIKMIDIDAFYGQRSGIAVKDRKIYTSVLGMYTFAKRVLKKLLQLGWRFLKMIKRVLR